MQIPFNDPLRQYTGLKSQVDAAISDVFESGWYLGGKEVEKFEYDFAKYIGTEYCISVASGTDALILALKTAGCKDGDEVITVANAGGYSSVAITSVNAVPVYLDIDPETLQMSLDKLVLNINKDTKAIIVTHLFGWMNDVENIRSILKNIGREDIIIIEDCAQAHGAEISGNKAGSLGDIAAFSFYPTKNLGAFGDAGAVVTSDKKIAHKISMLSQYGWKQKYHNEISDGINSRMDEIQAAVLNLKLPYLNSWNKRRREIINQYADACKGKPDINILLSDKTNFVGHLCVLQTPKRQELKHLLKNNGIKYDIHYPVLDVDQKPFVQYKPKLELENSKFAVGQIISLPCFPELEHKEVAHICQTLKDFE